MWMGSFAHGMPEKAHAASGATYENTQANEGRNCERKSGQEHPWTDGSHEVNAPGSHSQHHQGSEHEQRERHSDCSVMTSPPQESARERHSAHLTALLTSDARG